MMDAALDQASRKVFEPMDEVRRMHDFVEVSIGLIGNLVTINIRFWASRAAPGRPGRAQNCSQNCPTTGSKTARFVLR